MESDKNQVLGFNAEKVMELLRSRRSRLGTDQAPDGKKIGLIIEGGGMRGVLSAGSLLAIDMLGFRACFDAVYALSAGSVNAAYFLSGQGTEGITVYFDDISSKRFFNPWRVWKMVDVDFVYDYLVREVKPLDEQAILTGRPDFYVTASDVTTGKCVLLDTRSGAAPVARFLKASSALPVLYNRAVEIGGHRFMDGGVSGGLPLDWAIEQGCTDLVVLLSRPSSFVSRSPRFFERWVFRLVAGLKYPALYRSFVSGSEAREKNRRLAIGTEQCPGVNVATFSPDSREDAVGRTTIDRPLLVHGAYLTALKIFNAFGEDSGPLDRLFARFREGPGMLG